LRRETAGEERREKPVRRGGGGGTANKTILKSFERGGTKDVAREAKKRRKDRGARKNLTFSGKPAKRPISKISTSPRAGEEIKTRVNGRKRPRGNKREG